MFRSCDCPTDRRDAHWLWSVDNPERDNACYELEQSENCEHPQEG